MRPHFPILYPHFPIFANRMLHCLMANIPKLKMNCVLSDLNLRQYSITYTKILNNQCYCYHFLPKYLTFFSYSIGKFHLLPLNLKRFCFSGMDFFLIAFHVFNIESPLLFRVQIQIQTETVSRHARFIISAHLTDIRNRNINLLSCINILVWSLL